MVSSNLLSLFFFITFLSFSANSARLLVEDLITTTCSRTYYVDLCLSTLRADTRSQKADLKGLAKIALDISHANATNIISHLRESKPQNDASGHLKSYYLSCVEDCVDEYQDALGNLEEANTALDSNWFATADSFTTAAMTDSETCEDGFIDYEDIKSPLTEKNRMFSNLCSNALAILDILDDL
ncbi:hypothetical protein ACHQM5_010562 [Ranunculus cassubicifolius]